MEEHQSPLLLLYLRILYEAFSYYQLNTYIYMLLLAISLPHLLNADRESF